MGDKPPERIQVKPSDPEVTYPTPITHGTWLDMNSTVPDPSPYVEYIRADLYEAKENYRTLFEAQKLVIEKLEAERDELLEHIERLEDSVADIRTGALEVWLYEVRARDEALSQLDAIKAERDEWREKYSLAISNYDALRRELRGLTDED